MSFKTWRRERHLNRKAKRGPYPIHGRSLGYCDSAREPYTWFVCNHGHRSMGSPWAEPRHECFRCGFTEPLEFTGWRVADPDEAFEGTMEAIGPTVDADSLYVRTQE